MEVRQAIADLAEVRDRLAKFSASTAIRAGRRSPAALPRWPRAVCSLRWSRTRGAGRDSVPRDLARLPRLSRSRSTTARSWPGARATAARRLASQIRTVGMTILPAIVAGGVITLALVSRGVYDLLPGVWCIDLRARLLRFARDGAARRAYVAAGFGAFGTLLFSLPGIGRSPGGSCRPPSASVRSPSAPVRAEGRHARTIASMKPPAPFAYEGLERIFHERGRLAVCTCLVANANGLSFKAAGRLRVDRREPQPPPARAGRNRHRDAGAHARTGPPDDDGAHHRRGQARFLAYIDELEAVVRARACRATPKRRGAQAATGHVMIERAHARRRSHPAPARATSRSSWTAIAAGRRAANSPHRRPSRRRAR